MAGKPLRLLVVGLLLSCLVTGCSSMSRMPLDEFLPSPTREGPSGRQGKIAGYTTVDGGHHEFEGLLVAFSPDSLRFMPPTPAWGPHPTGEDQFSMAREEVKTVLVRKGDAGKTLALTAAVLSGALIGLAALVGAGVSGGVGLGN